MESRYSRDAARKLVESLGPSVGEDLALRVYTSRLLGQDPSLVLHGGGNTSVKSRVTEIVGDTTDVLFVKGSGWDLATIEPRGFPACRLARLRRLCELATMTDEQMVAELRGQMIDPSSPTPSVEALLHAFLPAKFVDHTHADAILAIVDQPSSEEIVERIWKGRALFVPYVMPGFVLARRVRDLWTTRGREPELMILDKHGVFTWGATAEESYERMIAAVDAAERYVLDEIGAPQRNTITSPPPDVFERVAPIARGCLARASGKSWIASWRATPAILSFLEADDAQRLSQIGCVTPDHVLRTKPHPLYFKGAEALDDAALAKALDVALERYAETYKEYFRFGCAARRTKKKELDPWPRVLLFEGLGALVVGASRREAEIAADVYEHTAGVIEIASALGQYEPVGTLDLFDVEYWSLEQAKLAKGATSAGPLAGKVALVTGGASGIGLATAKALLGAGAHVAVVDRDDAALASLETWAEGAGDRVHLAKADVTHAREVKRAFGAAAYRFGGVDVVVSNAGAVFQGALHTASGDAALRSSLEVNLLGHQNVARAATETMIAQRTGGALLFNASKSAFNQGPDFGPYAVAKAALVALMKQYAVDLAGHKIRANAINADRIRTNLFGGGVLEQRAKARGVPVDDYFKANLLGRETTAEDVAHAFVFLATAEATTGAVVTVDGGNAAAFPR